MVVYGAVHSDARHQAYALLAAAVKEEWGLTSLPEIARRTGGKPYFPQHPQLEFNLSHSGDRILCALDHNPVGVDIQMVKVLRSNLPNRVCSPQELAWLDNTPARWEGFALLWALKEAAVKYTGTGLTRSIPDIHIPLPAPEEDSALFGGLWFRVFRGTGWMGAVCGTSLSPPTIHWLELN